MTTESNDAVDAAKKTDKKPACLGLFLFVLRKKNAMLGTHQQDRIYLTIQTLTYFISILCLSSPGAAIDGTGNDENNDARARSTAFRSGSSQSGAQKVAGPSTASSTVEAAIPSLRMIVEGQRSFSLIARRGLRRYSSPRNPKSF